MVTIRLAGAITAAALGLAGCGVATSVVLQRSAGGAALPARAVDDGSSRPTPPMSPAATPPAPSPAATPAIALPPSTLVVVRSAANGNTQALRVLNDSGAVVASAIVTSTASWSTTTGPAGVYWIDNGTVHELTLDGAVRTVASVPASVTQMLVSPNGGEYAYATASPAGAGGVMSDNRIYVQRFGAPAHVLADRLSDPNHPTADAPGYWEYYLISWTDQGILFARVPQGGCGCGPFDMEMQSGDSALIDPSTGRTVAVTEDASCPLSGLGPGRDAACFATAGGAGATELRIMNGPGVVQRFGMSGQNVAGGAVFSGDGSAVAYLTIPSAQAGCGGIPAATLHVLTRAGGAANSIALAGLSSVEWSSTGAVYGLDDGASSAWLDRIDAATMHVTRMWSGPAESSLVGLISA